jgi:putative transposase
MEVSDAKRLRGLKQENQKLKRLLAEAELDKTALKEPVSVEWQRPRSDVEP